MVAGGQCVDKLNVDGATLAYQATGSGHPVLMIHGAAIADTFVPLVRQPELGTYRAIRYHRRGYGDSTGTAASLPEHASDALALLKHIDAEPAHIIGHSYGGCTALQMALMSPQAVRSLILLEPAMITQIPSAEECASGLTPILEVFAAGEGRRAVDLFLRTMCSARYRHYLDENVSPDAFEQAGGHADSLFQGDLRSLTEWVFGPDQAAAIRCPVQVLLGTESGAPVRESTAALGTPIRADIFAEMVAVVEQWVVQAEVVHLKGLNHSLQFQNPSAVARAIAPFLERHSVRA
jgi:pimeloyl-ACP methyl ester carboxylesterase